MSKQGNGPYRVLPRAPHKRQPSKRPERHRRHVIDPRKPRVKKGARAVGNR